jgi:nucleotide-binding universal stress UspA family protein
MLEAEERGAAYLHAYLDDKKAEVEKAGFQVKLSVLVGRAPEQLLDAAVTTKPDLIALASHGRSGAQRWWLGSVADKLVRSAECPILVVGPNVEVDLSSFSPKRIPLPLDGSSAAEAAIPIAVSLARASAATLDVIDVVSTAAVTYASQGDYAFDVLGTLEDAAATYLKDVLSRMSGDTPVTTAVLSGYPPDQLSKWATDEKVDLLVMTTHARHGLARTILGSVADRMLLGPVPVLLIRPEEVASSRLAHIDTEAGV